MEVCNEYGIVREEMQEIRKKFREKKRRQKEKKKEMRMSIRGLEKNKRIGLEEEKDRIEGIKKLGK